MSDYVQRWKAVQIPFEKIAALSDEQKCISLSERDVGILLSQVQYAHWFTRWSKEGGLSDADKASILEWANGVESRLMDNGECDVVCHDYGMYSRIMDIQPSNPYIDPDFIPTGYLTPAWSIASADVPFTEIKAGDLLAAVPTTGADYPRVRIRFFGEAEIEVHYVTIPFGGMLQTQKDGDILTLGYTDLNADIVAFPPEANTEEMTLEFKFEGAGEHFLDLTVLPRFNDEIELVGLGGGLRKVVICGANAECIDMPILVRQNTETPCILEKSDDGAETWVEFADLSLCPPTLVEVNGVLYIGVPGEGGTVITQVIEDNPTVQPPPRARAGGADDNRCNAAANAVTALMSLHDTIKSAAGSGAAIWTIIGLVISAMAAFVFFPPAAPFLVAAITALLADFTVLTTSFSTSDRQDLQCYLFNQATDSAGLVTFDYAGFLGDLAGDSRDSFHLLAAYVGLLGESGLNYAASSPYVNDAVCECEGWVLQQYAGHGDAQIDYTPTVVASGYPANTATHNASLDRAEGDVTSSGGSNMAGCPIRVTLPDARTITRIQYAWESDNTVPGETVTAYFMYDASNSLLSTGYSTTQSGSMNIDGLAVAGVKKIDVYVRGYEGTFTRINNYLIAGTGANPFA